MKSTTNPINPTEYDTSINVIGGLQDCSVIYKTIVAYFSESDTINDLIWERNELALRTERSRTRVQNAIKSSFLDFKDENHKALIQNLFATDHRISRIKNHIPQIGCSGLQSRRAWSCRKIGPGVRGALVSNRELVIYHMVSPQDWRITNSVSRTIFLGILSGFSI
jgi:hypothetical protein